MNDQWDLAGGDVCPRCGNAALRFQDGVCQRCAQDSHRVEQAAAERRIEQGETWLETTQCPRCEAGALLRLTGTEGRVHCPNCGAFALPKRGGR